MARVILKRGREKPILNRHPWVFSGAIKRIEGQCDDGDVVEVADWRGRFLARGYLNRRSQIAVRLLTWDEGEVIGRDFWRRRLERAIASRQALADDPSTDAYRLVNAESDLLPGLIVDRYGEYLVVQFLTLGIERGKAALVGLLAALLEPRGLYARDGGAGREEEHDHHRTAQPTDGRRGGHGARLGACEPALVRCSGPGSRSAALLLPQLQQPRPMARYGAGGGLPHGGVPEDLRF